MSSDVVDQALIDGFEKGISTSLGMIPVVGGFVSVIFTEIWGLAFLDRTLAQKKAALDSLFESVSNMIGQALQELISDQARAYNATIAQTGQDYAVSVNSYKDKPEGGSTKVVVRFESCKNTLVHMMNLFSQQSYMKHVLLSYGTALTMYVGLLKEMINSGADCGYSPSEIADFQNDINERLSGAFKILYDATCKLVVESGEFRYPSLAQPIMALQQAVAGTMSFNTKWHNNLPCVIPEDDIYLRADTIDSKAHYQLRFRPKVGVSRTYYSMPQVYMAGRPAIHVYTDVLKDLEVAKFVPKMNMNVRLRAYYLVDENDYDSNNVSVTISTYENPQVASFNLEKRAASILSFPWVKMYYSNTEGGAWSTDFDRFSKAMRMHYDEYATIAVTGESGHTIVIKGGSSAVKNYYFIGFEVIPA